MVCFIFATVPYSESYLLFINSILEFKKNSNNVSSYSWRLPMFLGNVLNTFHILSFSPHNNVILFLYVKKWRHRELKWLSQSRAADAWWSQWQSFLVCADTRAHTHVRTCRSSFGNSVKYLNLLLLCYCKVGPMLCFLCALQIIVLIRKFEIRFFLPLHWVDFL